MVSLREYHENDPNKGKYYLELALKWPHEARAIHLYTRIRVKGWLTLSHLRAWRSIAPETSRTCPFCADRAALDMLGHMLTECEAFNLPRMESGLSERVRGDSLSITNSVKFLAGGQKKEICRSGSSLF